MASNDTPRTDRTLLGMLMALIVAVLIFFFAACWSFMALNTRLSHLEYNLMQQAVSLHPEAAKEASLDMNQAMCQMLNLSAAAMELKERFKCN